MKRLLIMALVLVFLGAFLPDVMAQVKPQPNYNSGTAQLKLSVTFEQKPIIAIELNEKSWVIGRIGLGQKRRNEEAPVGITIEKSGNIVTPPYPRPPKPMHTVRNIGNIPISIDIGYAQYEGCGAGLEPGVDQFATALCKDGYIEPGAMIPPNGRIVLVDSLDPEGRGKDIPLVYYSPTALTQDVKGMSAVYELRAYSNRVGIL